MTLGMFVLACAGCSSPRLVRPERSVAQDVAAPQAKAAASTSAAAVPVGRSVPAACALPRLTKRGCCLPESIGWWKPAPCRSTYASGAFSFLPNIGLQVSGGRVIRRTADATTSLEVAAALQFLDDEDFINDGNPKAGDWWQVRAGAKVSYDPAARRHVTLRYGGVWLQANGEPNIIQTPGNYYGVYAAGGFETDVSSCLTVGPEIAIMAVTKENDLKIRTVPQLNYHVTWWLDGRRRGGALSRPPVGEFYVGGVGLMGPGLGGGFEAGQVFARTPKMTWAFEMQAAWQDPGQGLWFNSDGKWGQVRGGLKATFAPCCKGHLVFRGGASWLRSTARTTFLDTSFDHIGGYVGVGYEVDVTPRFTTGPELSVLFVSRENKPSLFLIPQLSWHAILKL